MMEWLKRIIGLKSRSIQPEGGIDQFVAMQVKLSICVINYTDTKVYCYGFFRWPTKDEIELHSRMPYAIFQPITEGFWTITAYSPEEVSNMTKPV